jgi:hypothetical protein
MHARDLKAVELAERQGGINLVGSFVRDGDLLLCENMCWNDEAND